MRGRSVPGVPYALLSIVWFRNRTVQTSRCAMGTKASRNGACDARSGTRIADCLFPPRGVAAASGLMLRGPEERAPRSRDLVEFGGVCT